ncbi:MAG: thiamine pyrophosphate-dependent enzyme [Candidatus Poribacteria bacterium]|nr:thiamine pyrophosphate-dependent enzyme [Candidatus Poribacteria bacterium]
MDERFTQSEGTNVYTGCELLVKGSLESGVSLLTGYPGSPISEVFDVLQRNSDLLKSNGIVAQIANNEALGIARLNGSQMAEMRAIAFMKSVGMHVASDSLAISNLAGTTGGAVVVVGDDTWSYSTQVPADSRVLARHLYMPLLEPSTWQELKNWVNCAFEISAEANLYTCYLTTQNQADGGGNVELHPNRYPTISKIAQTELDTDLISIDNRVILPPDTVRVEVEMLSERFPTALDTAKRLGLNKIIYPENDEGKTPSTKHKIGFVTAGFSYCYLEHALTELNLSDRVPILKLGMTHPIDQDIVLEFANMVDELYVIEEKRPVIENEIKAFLTQKYQEEKLDKYVKVWGKQFPDGLQGIPVVAGLDTSILIQRLIPLFSNSEETKAFSFDFPIDNVQLEEEAKLQQEVSNIKADIPARTPTFCPGCPHRDSSSVLLEMTDQFMDPAYMQKHHDSTPVDLVFHGDIGCYSMLKYEPFPRLMHNLSAMTLGGGAGAGIDPFIVNKQVVFMGDSTFFHGGMSAISDSIKNNQDITYIILDNQTTAMTGHQPTPADELDILGNPTFAQDIEKVANGLAGGSEISVVRVNPEDRLNYKKYLEKSILKSGVKIIIADKECAITLHRRLRREQQSIKEKAGFLKVEKHINITSEVCEFCLECTKSTGCPALKIIDTDYGNKIAVDRSNCVTDGACARIKWACPSFEEVVVTRKRPPRKQQIQQIDRPKEKNEDNENVWEESGISDLLSQLDLNGGHTLPSPIPQPFDKIWSVYAAGVGGMGIGTISKILVVAGYLQGYDVHFCDRKGLAIRNGGVYTHVTYTNSRQKISPIIPYGKADLVLGLDILEAVRGISAESVFRVASSGRTDSVVNTAKTDTIRSLIGEDSFEIGDLEDTIKENTKTYYGINLFEVSEQLFGTKLYANIMLLGVAFQRGLIPIALEPIQIALKQMVRRSDLQQNMNALEVGRYLAVSENADTILSKQKSDVLSQTYKQALEEKKSILSSKFRGNRLANSYVSLVENVVQKFNLDESTNRSIAIYVYDLIQYEGLGYAQRYIEKIEHVFEKDYKEYNATKAAIKYLHKVMLIKDEVYVSHLLTSKEKLARDKMRYNVDEKNGDKIRYLHLNRPHFTVLGIDIQHDIDTRNWMLHVMKRMKFLRRWLSQWHAKEREFREWYIREVIDTFSTEDDVNYSKHLQAIECVENVRGYRAIRYPTMEAAKQEVETLLNKDTS